MQSTTRRLLFATAFSALMLWVAVVSPVAYRARDGLDWGAIVLVNLIPTSAAVYLLVSGWRLGRSGLERVVPGMLVLLAVAWVVRGAWQSDVAEAARRTCLRNLKHVTMSLLVYAEDHNGRLPQADAWVEAVSPYLPAPERLRCPADRTQARCSYGMNSALSEVDIHALRDPESIVLIYETARPGDNPAGGPENVGGRHTQGAGDYYGFANGHVGWIPRKKLGTDSGGNPIWAKEPDADRVIWEWVLKKPENEGE